MQNSLERLFEGLDHTLRTIVGPSLTDPYLQTQIAAVAEIVRNLSTRVEWRCDQLLEEIGHVRAVLQRAEGAMPSGELRSAVLAAPEPAPGWGNAELVAARDRHLRALQELQRALADRPDPELDSSVREFLRWQIDREAGLLRTGMFSAPKSEVVA